MIASSNLRSSESAAPLLFHASVSSGSISITLSYHLIASSWLPRLSSARPYGIITKMDAKGDELTEQKYSKHSKKIIEKFQYMIDNKGEIPEQMRTRKFVQRVIPKKWGEKGPNITATSLPDDFVHYSQPRSITVREWARLQLFPDWYKFSGSRTTGGRKRAGDFSNGDWKRETPRYTQIGNAVPVKLAEEIGKHLKKLID